MSISNVEHLGKIPLFNGLDEERLHRIADLANPFEVPAGTVLIERSQAGSGLFVIEHGTARVDLPGDRHIELGEGDFFGEIAVVADIPRTARVAASSELSGLAIRRQDLLTLLEGDASIAVAMLQEVARRLAGALEQAT